VSDGAAALGISSRAPGGRLAASFALVDASGHVELPPWRGGSSDLGRQLLDLRDTLRNVLDGHSVTAVAIKRCEAPPGRPGDRYDERVMFDGAVRLASAEAGVRVLIYRTREMERALRDSPPPADVGALAEQQAEATTAAYAALCDLGEDLER
jgi:hypothetical protein